MENCQMPVLLRASNGQKARNFVVPPKQPDERHKIKMLYCQSIHMPVFHLTTSEEFPINVAHYEVASMCHYSTKIFIASSPIFTVHYEICPPSEKLEEFTNPRLRNVSDLMLKPPARSNGKLLQMNWLNVKLTTAYGIHSAVQRVITTAKIRNVRKIKAQKMRFQMSQAADYLPQSEICETHLLKAPKRETLKLCTTNDTDKEPKKVTEIVIEEQFYDAVDSHEVSVSNSCTVQINSSCCSSCECDCKCGCDN
ncbi:hypothetical protein M3Y97_00594600 [Aphelenchoides bicaudatus]|nr:hypothetical protein M3Y97_00594600 [Aphelenchoides bicaudatus]